MIVDIELKLKEIFSYLKPIKDAKGNEYKPVFDWGTEEILNKFMVKHKQPYPLIWLVTGTNRSNNDIPERNTRLIIATRSKMPEEFNSFQHEHDFKVILYPVLNNVIRALKVNGMTSIDKDFKYQNLPNFGVVKDKTKTIDVWNAVVLDINIKLINNCIINKKY